MNTSIAQQAILGIRLCLMAGIFIATFSVGNGVARAIAQATTSPGGPPPSKGSVPVQSGSRIGAALSLVPLYPPDGVIPEQLKTHYVFRSLDSWDHIVSYPATLSTGSRSDDEVRITHRITSRRNVSPTIDCVVSRVENGMFRYLYVLGNGGTAKQPLGEFALPVGRYVPPDPLCVAHRGDPAVINAGAWQVIPHYEDSGTVMLKFSAAGDGQALAPSGPLKTVVIESELLPGLVPAFFQSEDTQSRLAAELPEQVRSQLVLVRRIGFDSVVSTTVAPKFPASANKLWIASDFHFHIQSWARAGSVDAGSPFLSALLRELEEFLARPRQDLPLDELPPSSLVFVAPRTQPASQAEIAIRDAVHKSLVER